MPPPAHNEQLVQALESNPVFTSEALATPKAMLRHHGDHSLDMYGIHSPVYMYWRRLGRNLIAYFKADQTNQDLYH